MIEHDPSSVMALLMTLEHQLNQFLALDSVTVRRLSEYEGRVVEVRCVEPEVTCFLHFERAHIRLASVYEGNVDVVVSGSTVALLTMLQKRDQSFETNQGLTVSGDVTLLNSLCAICHQAEWDWEGALCSCIGDTAGHIVSLGAQQLLANVRYGKQAVMAQCIEYVEAELGLLPSRMEADTLANDVKKIHQQLNDLERSIIALGVSR